MNLMRSFQKNRALWITLAVLVLMLLFTMTGMSSRDWVITLLRGLSVGALTFLVASGFSIIFGLLEVLNLAHGTLFMIGAYVGWTVYLRPDTFLDVLTPILLLLAGFALNTVWEVLIGRMRVSGWAARLWPWVGLLLAVGLLLLALPKYPISIWNPGQYDQSPVTYGYMADQGQRIIPPPAAFGALSPVLLMGTILLGGLLGTFSLVGLLQSVKRAAVQQPSTQLWKPAAVFAGLVLLGLLVFIFNDALTLFLFSINTTWLFLIALLAALATGIGLGAFMESTLIRPLYVRPTYQLMMTLGVSAIGIEIVRAIWGRPEFVFPKPALFNGSGAACPAKTLADWLAYQCATINFLGARVRVYNEILLPILGVVVLVAVWIILQRSRIGMIIRAGVQDREMVEALGINVRQVFTLVFAMGVGLAALGGILAAPSTGLSNAMGEHYLLNALIALAIGGLTSYPGAAVGSLLVGMMEQFMIKYGQIGIQLPFLAEPFKPTPPLVPASSLLLMVIILLILPQGLFGRKE